MDGEPVRLESSHALHPSVEGITAAFFFHSLAFKRPLQLPGALDAVLASNMEAAGKIAQDYWTYSSRVQSLETQQLPPARTDQQAMFFTCGVDSFYTLRMNLETVSALINVFGFDIETDDVERFQKSQAGLEQTAAELGLELISVKTALRQHKLFRKLSWNQTHVAALALVAHCLPDYVAQVRVASSDGGPPWGSHTDLDKLWSSSRLEVINDEDLTRYIKIKRIVDWAPAQQTLKVCWQNFTDDLNCGYCEKCLRTQFGIIAAGGDLDAFKSFPPTDLLAELDKLPKVTPRHISQWQAFYDNMPDGPPRGAVKRLLRRSKFDKQLQRLIGPPLRFAHKVKRKLKAVRSA